MLKITCEVLDQQQVGKKFDMQMKKASGVLGNRTTSTSTSNLGTKNYCINIPVYFRSSANKEADKKESRLLTTKIHSGFSEFLQVSAVLRYIQATGERRQPPISNPTKKGSLCNQRSTIRRSRKTTKATNNSIPRC